MSSGTDSVSVKLDFSSGKGFFDIPQMGFFSQPFQNVEIFGNEITLAVDKDNGILIKGNLVENKINGSIEDESSIVISLKKISTEPDLYSEEDVSYNSDGLKLSGTLILPKTKGPYTAIVFIHGSGKMTRETMRNRAYMLVKNGYAALIYDRRGRGKSEGSSEQILPMQTLARDALAGVDFLKSRKDINTVGVYGLSRGGWVAPLCASLSNNVSFLITISAAGITPDEQNKFVSSNIVSNNLKKILSSSKVPENDVNIILENLKLNEKIYGVKKEKTESYLVFSSFYPAAVWEKISIPVLSLWGEKDVIVPAAESRNIIENALNKANNKDFTLRIFENSNHLLKLDNQKFAGKWEISAPESNEFIISWLRAHF